MRISFQIPIHSYFSLNLWRPIHNYIEQDTTKLLSPINEKTGLFTLKKSSSDVLLDMTKHLNLFYEDN